MARSLSLSLSQTLTVLPRQLSPKSRILSLRSQSNKTEQQQQHHSADESDTEALFSKLEDAIHRIIVRRSAPDWLPFIPGSSYWVPPPHRSRSQDLVQLVHKLANPLTQDESMSTTSHRGWPSSSYFIHGASPHPVEVEIISNNVSQSEDEEG